MDVVVRGEKVIEGDCVLLSCGDSERIMRVRDVDGCQIRLDGEVKSIERDWCKVLVQVEERGQITYSLMHTKLRNVELTDRVHVWSKVNAKQIDRVRRYGNNECESLAPQGKSSFKGLPKRGRQAAGRPPERVM